ncbi:MAG TPA: Holliday junction branch migration DNA helicase RuvB [Planctomycetota bacterium]|nr:Holliday junction branch migration DNA helicase RuvB [Planctomycetota bacterium]
MDEAAPFQASPQDDEEVGVERSLRPTRLDEFIGQRRIVENLRIAIEAAKARGDVLDHVLFSGMPGLGKTTLASLIAGELGVELHITSGPALDKPRNVIGLLTNLKRGDVLFIDEIHRLATEAEEYLYSAMEDWKVDLLLGVGADARTLRISVEAFTLVGATTREGLLSAPFRSRFGIVEKFETYPPSDLLEIIRRSAKLLGCTIEDDGALYLAERCRGTPRYANRFLRRIRDIAQWRIGGGRCEDPPAAGSLVITLEFVREGLERLGIDDNGLDRIDRMILDVLFLHKEPVGVKTIAVSIGEEERTIEDVYEPYLIQRGLLLKTPRGRRPSARASEMYRPSKELLS